MIRMQSAIATLATALVLVLGRPAEAAVTAQLNLLGPNPNNGACPVSISFSGSIKGTQGTVFTYSFNRFVNGVQQVVNVGTTTMPPSGSIAVNDAIAISSSTSGATFDQIWVHNISGGQADVYSNKAAFTVNCQAPGPTSPPVFRVGNTRHPNFPLTLVPQAPTSFTNTTDPSACAAHVNLLFCNASLQAGDLALIWNWSDPSYPSLDGYRVFRVDGGRHQKVVESSVGKDITGTFLHTPPTSACFVVAAYVGTTQGSDSRPYCFGGAAFVATTAYIPNHIKIAYNINGNSTGFGGALLQVAGGSPFSSDNGVHAFANQFGEVGWWHFTNKDWLGDSFTNGYARSGVAYDLSSLSGKHVYKAVMRMHMYGANTKGNLDTGNFTECAAWILPGIAPWWNDGNMIEDQFASALSIGNAAGPPVAIDVTSIVQSWQAGAPNYGFVLQGNDENLGVFYDGQCVSFFDPNPILEITHD